MGVWAENQGSEVGSVKAMRLAERKKRSVSASVRRSGGMGRKVAVLEVRWPPLEGLAKRRLVGGC